MFIFCCCFISLDAVNAVLDSIDEIQFLQDTPWIHRDVESMRQVLNSSRLHSLLTVRNGKSKCLSKLAVLLTFSFIFIICLLPPNEHFFSYRFFVSLWPASSHSFLCVSWKERASFRAFVSGLLKEAQQSFQPSFLCPAGCPISQHILFFFSFPYMILSQSSYFPQCSRMSFPEPAIHDKFSKFDW
jgi:hypothetical protein